MSRTRSTRILLALASLLGAIPLLAQTQPRADAPFPYGSYTSTLPADDNHTAARTLQVELREGAMQVSEDGQVIQSYVTNVSGRHLKLWRMGGGCDAQGDYTWALQGGTLTFSLVSDACPGRGEKIVRTRLVRAAAPAALSFPFGRYALVAIDTLNGPPPGIEIEFTPEAVKVFQGPQQVEAHAITFATNGDLQFFELGAECAEVGEYSWTVAGEWLELTQVSDPCQQRSQSIMAVHFKKL